MEENKVLNEMEETTEMEQVNNDWVVDSEEETTESSGLGKVALVAIAGAVVAGGVFAFKKIRGHFAKKHEVESHEVPDIKVTEVEEADEE